MKKISFLIMALLVTAAAGAQSVQFETSIAFHELLKRAKQEGKYIFIDCYTTWCGPCKQMDREAFRDPQVGQLINTGFIAAKFQMDKTKVDAGNIHARYADAEMLEKKFSIQSYPTLLFLSPDGELVYKAIGLKKPEELLSTAKLALDKVNNYQGRMEAFRQGKISFQEGRNLSKELRNAGETNLAREIAQHYLKNYLDKLPDDSLLRPEFIAFMRDNISLIKGNSRAFNFFKNNGAAVDTVFKYPGLSNKILMNIVMRDEISIHLLEKGVFKDVVPDWSKYDKTITGKYGKKLADQSIYFIKFNWFVYKKDWPNAILSLFKKIEVIGMPRAGVLDELQLNNELYEVVLTHSKNAVELQKAADLQKIIVERNPDKYIFMDTYASLLYRLGRKPEAVSLEEQALKMAGEAKDKESEKFFAGILEKMKKGELIW